MADTKLTWYTKLEGEEIFSPSKERFVGTHTPRNNVALKIQLWNNRLGIKDAGDLKNFTIQLKFQDEEDISLLKYFRAKDANGNKIDVQLYDDHALLALPVGLVISGKANNGITIENRENYYEFQLSLETPENVHLKENDFKSLYLDIVSR